MSENIKVFESKGGFTWVYVYSPVTATQMTNADKAGLAYNERKSEGARMAKAVFKGPKGLTLSQANAALGNAPVKSPAPVSVPAPAPAPVRKAARVSALTAERQEVAIATALVRDNARDEKIARIEELILQAMTLLTEIERK